LNLNDGNVFHLTDFDDNMEQTVVLPLYREIQKQSSLREGYIDLYINSFGGYRHLVFELISLVELAKRNGVIVRTVVPDIAYSAGSILAVTGTPGERYIERGGEHLLHYGFTGGGGESTPEQVERNTIQKREGFKKIYKHYDKYTEVPGLKEKMNDDSFFVPATSCIKWKIADKYMDKFDINASRRANI